MKPAKTDYDKAQKKANKAEANRLAKLLKKLDRDLVTLKKKHNRELDIINAAWEKKYRSNKRDFSRAERTTAREKKQIYRRLQILNGRGL